MAHHVAWPMACADTVTVFSVGYGRMMHREFKGMCACVRVFVCMCERERSEQLSPLSTQ